MRLRWQILVAAVILTATPSIAEPYRGNPLLEHDGNFRQDPASAKAHYTEDVANELKPQEPDTDLLALMSGKCSTLRIAGRDFACRTVAYAHSTRGRAYFCLLYTSPSPRDS